MTTEELAQQLNLHRAWQRVKRNSRRDPIPPTIEYSVYEAHIEENLNALREQIAGGFLSSPPKTVDLVKPNLTLRSCTIPEIPDRIYYQALVDRIADEVDDKLFGQRTCM